MSEIPEDITQNANVVGHEVEETGDFMIIARAILAERERCAKVCEQMPTTTGLEKIYAERIRTGWQPK